MVRLSLSALLLLILLTGCGTAVAPRVPSGPPAPDIDRDQLLSLAAACHLLRVSQASDIGVTDATVIAAARQYGFSMDEVLARSGELIEGSRARQTDLGGVARASCARLAALTGAPPAAVRLRSSVQTAGNWVRVSGEIQDGFADRVIAQIRKSGAVGVVIDSRGGLVSEARRLGRYLRSSGLNVAVDKTCLSACVDVLAGGTQRFITPDAVLGIHQSKAPDRQGSHEGGQAYVAGSALYLQEMGIDDNLALLAAVVPHDRIFVISTDLALRSGLATAVIRSL